MAEAPGDQFRKPPSGAKPNQWIENYAAIFVEIAREFAADVTVIESFNEPDDWNGQEENWLHPHWFAILLQTVYDRVRADAALNHIKLISGPLTRIADQWQCRCALS